MNITNHTVEIPDFQASVPAINFQVNEPAWLWYSFPEIGLIPGQTEPVAEEHLKPFRAHSSHYLHFLLHISKLSPTALLLPGPCLCSPPHSYELANDFFLALFCNSYLKKCSFHLRWSIRHKISNVYQILPSHHLSFALNRPLRHSFLFIACSVLISDLLLHLNQKLELKYLLISSDSSQ